MAPMTVTTPAPDDLDDDPRRVELRAWLREHPNPSGRELADAGLVAAHLQWHLERQLRSLPLVERRAFVADQKQG